MSWKKIGVIAGLIIIAISVIWFWWRYYFPFAEGVKSGQLNYIEKKGYIFKTWEGRLVQDGFRANPTSGMGSIEFRFSVADDSLASVLERTSGKWVEVRYTEYFNSIMWRGASEFVVTEILSSK